MQAKMVFFDCDGTLIEGGLWTAMFQAAGITDDRNLTWMTQYYNGEISFEAWINHISAALRPTLTRSLFERIMDGYVIFPDAREITQYLRKRNIPMAIISSGSDYYVSRVADHLGIEIWRANSFFLFDETGKFLEMKYTYVDPVAKTNQIKDICKEHGIDPENTLFVGDSYNDISSFKLTKHGVLYKKKDEKLLKEAWKSIDNHNEIKKLLNLRK